MILRTAEETIRDHLGLAQDHQWNFEQDLERNFSDDVVFLTSFGKFTGKDGARELYQRLSTLLPNGKWEYKKIFFDGPMGFLRWNATSDNGVVKDGADSYYVENGKITVMTIHYTVEK